MKMIKKYKYISRSRIRRLRVSINKKTVNNIEKRIWKG